MHADEVEENDELTANSGTARRGCVINGEINGVLVCSEYLSCISCKSKVKELNELLGECSKCKMIMKKGNKCNSSSMVKVLIGNKKEPVTLFENVISKIINGVDGENLSIKLLCAPEH